jgi:hypothetical protein
VNWLAKEGAPFSIGKKADRDPGSFQGHLESANFLPGPGGRGQLAPTYRDRCFSTPTSVHRCNWLGGNRGRLSALTTELDATTDLTNLDVRD